MIWLMADEEGRLNTDINRVHTTVCECVSSRDKSINLVSLLMLSKYCHGLMTMIVSILIHIPPWY